MSWARPRTVWLLDDGSDNLVLLEARRLARTRGCLGEAGSITSREAEREVECGVGCGVEEAVPA